ncbi:protein takeout [Condylostylus longicornis]|uniref:protein takeout n=1 Tax=Condylostylus longicornis TaxID=2530218 RepID=UPI00244E329A|nr:protein takeout [Condylostylus longicornis]
MYKTYTIYAVGTLFSLFLTVQSGREIINNAPQLKERPEWLLTCKRENPNENFCFQRLFQQSFPALAKGIPEIGIKNFEPLYIDGVSVSRGSGNLVLTGGFENLIIRGPSNATVKRASLNLEKKLLSFDLEIPLLRIRSNYNLKGNILLLPLVGSGNVNLALKDVKTSVYTKISLKNKPEEVIHIEDMKVNFLVGDMRIHLTNLFNGNEILAASINSFLNQNAHEVIAELRNDLESGLADIFKALWNNVFSKMPLKLWLL